MSEYIGVLILLKNFFEKKFSPKKPSIFSFCNSVHFHSKAICCVFSLIVLFGDDSGEEEVIEQEGDDSAEQKAESSSSSEAVEKP